MSNDYTYSIINYVTFIEPPLVIEVNNYWYGSYLKQCENL